jgi:hypothetical protein
MEEDRGVAGQLARGGQGCAARIREHQPRGTPLDGFLGEAVAIEGGTSNGKEEFVRC